VDDGETGTDRETTRESEIEERKVELVGTREGVEELLRLIGNVAPTDARVLITGATGTGKNLVAEVIHLLHPQRWPQEFRRTNVGALVPQLAQSQLYGHKKGAFTGALKDSEGIVLEADRGTLFLDQLSDAEPNVQEMLLTLLEVRRINPVGASAGDPRPKVDIRLVSATLESPPALRNHEKFRRDLFYRVMEYHIPLPPLKERKLEIVALARYFLDEADELRRPPWENRDPPLRKLTRISPKAERELKRYPWEGNVRELQHVIRAAVVSSRQAPEATELKRKWLVLPAASSESLSLRWSSEPGAYKRALKQFNCDWARKTLDLCNSNRKKASKLMGVAQDTLRKYLAYRRGSPGEKPQA
jgi:DNA-binding NtrC family response regulator